MAEIELNMLRHHCLNRPIPDKATMTIEVNAWVEERIAKIVKTLLLVTTADA